MYLEEVNLLSEALSKWNPAYELRQAKTDLNPLSAKCLGKNWLYCQYRWLAKVLYATTKNPKQSRLVAMQRVWGHGDNNDKDLKNWFLRGITQLTL